MCPLVVRERESWEMDFWRGYYWELYSIPSIICCNISLLRPWPKTAKTSQVKQSVCIIGKVNLKKICTGWIYSVLKARNWALFYLHLFLRYKKCFWGRSDWTFGFLSAAWSCLLLLANHFAWRMLLCCLFCDISRCRVSSWVTCLFRFFNKSSVFYENWKLNFVGKFPL